MKNNTIFEKQASLKLNYLIHSTRVKLVMNISMQRKCNFLSKTRELLYLSIPDEYRDAYSV